MSQTPSKPGENDRIDSWKAIAAFFGRDERTVRRWEKERALPVHRLPGERGSVFAYKADLSRWLNSAPVEVIRLEAASPPDRVLQTYSSATASTDSAAITEEDNRLRLKDVSPKPSKGNTPAEPGLFLVNANGPSSEAKVEPQTVEAAGRNRDLGGRPGHARRVRLAVIGMAAALAGAGIYASLAHPLGHWIQQHLPAIAGIGPASSIRQVVTPVSDVEKSVAHDLYLKGRFEWNQRTPDALNRALDDFTQAIVHNPNDARAYAGLADTYEMLFIYGSRQDDDARDRAMAAAKKAVELDSSLPEAHRALGYAVWRARNFGEAEKELNLAIQLDPKDPLAHVWLSNVLASQGKDGECLAEIAKAQELDPASASILAIKGDRLYLTGKKEEGIALLKEAVRSEPHLSIAHVYLAMAEFEERNYLAYLKESQAAAELRKDPWLKDVTAKLSAAYAQDGQRGFLSAEFAVQENCGPPVYPGVSPMTRTQRAIGCLDRDRRPEALQLLEEASANQEKDFGDFQAAFISGSSREVHRLASKLADDPRFQALMKQKADLPKPAKLSASLRR